MKKFLGYTKFMIQNVIKCHTAIAYANSADLEEQSDQVLHCLPFHKIFQETTAQKAKFRQKKNGIRYLKF